MHHTYAFLLSRNNFDISLSPDELGQQSVSWVERDFFEGSDYEDEWYTPICLITNGGRVLDLLPDGNTSDFKQHFKLFTDLHKEKRLPRSLKLAVEIAATDMGLYDCKQFIENEGNKRIQQSSMEKLIDDIMFEIPHKLSSLYLDMEGKKRSAGELNDHSYICRTRKELAIQFEEFCESLIPGFSSNRRMPHYRCFDLREQVIPEHEDELMVLLIDIHK